MQQPSAILALLALVTAVNVLAAALNLAGYLRLRRRARRLHALERRLEAGPVTDAMRGFTRESASERWPAQPASQRTVR